jgi:hypothetical protein
MKKKLVQVSRVKTTGLFVSYDHLKIDRLPPDFLETANAILNERAGIDASASQTFDVLTAFTGNGTEYTEEQKTQFVALMERQRQLLDEREQQKPSLQAASNLLDIVPVPRLRKALKKLLADQAAHLDEVYAHDRPISAKFVKYGTWLLLGWTAVAYFATYALQVVKKARSIL